jgi:hypothetical protein
MQEPDSIATAAADLEETLLGKDKSTTLVILIPLDNVAYVSLSPDGNLTTGTKGAEGVYHMIGEVMACPLNVLKMHLKRLLPVLNTIRDQKKVFTSPLPRYWDQPCCSNSSHMPNWEKISYRTSLLRTMDAQRRFIKDEVFHLGIKNIRVANVAAGLTKDGSLFQDATHPTEAGYIGIWERLLDLYMELDSGAKEDSARRPRAASTPHQSKNRRRSGSGTGSGAGGAKH